MRKKKIITLMLSLTLVVTSIGLGYAADEIAICPEESPAETVSGADAEAGDLLIAPAPTTTTTNIKKITPAVKAARYSYSKIKLTWDKIEKADGYVIYRATSKSGKFKKLATVSASKTSYINTGLTCGKTYYYKLRAYDKQNGKTVYSKYSAVVSAKPYLSKSTVVDAWGDGSTTTGIYVKYKGIAGATDYQIQYRYTENGKTTDWTSKLRSMDDNEWITFTTYSTYLREAKKENPSGKVRVVKYGELGSEMISVENYAANCAGGKNTATVFWLDQRENQKYEFRVRAYRTVDGKKVYGAWSEPYAMVETFDIDRAYKELNAYAIEYAAENFPEFEYEPNRVTEGSNDANSSYYIWGDMGGASMYCKTDEFIEAYKESIADYIDYIKNTGGQESGFIYIKKMHKGDTDGMLGNRIYDDDQVKYSVWFLY